MSEETIGGFLYFAETVAALEAPSDPKADAIVVLTGGYQRIDRAIGLLKQGAGQRLLISGVNPATSGNQIRKLTQSSSALFECCVDMGYEAVDTIGNANETARWISDHQFRRVLVVTNNYHMPRSLLELKVIDPRLIVMDRGHIVEEGTHAELVARGGLYADLWSRQSGGFLGHEEAAQ